MKISICQPLPISELGSRQNQEDSLYPLSDEATADSRLFMLCDGMGGHDNGEVASRMVCDALPRSLDGLWHDGPLTDDMLAEAMDDVFASMRALDNGTIRQMGTTMTLVAIHRGGVTMAHIGDSRIYHVRPSEGRLLYKSRDHSLVYDLFLAGEISQQEMASYDRKNVITRAISPSAERQPRMDIAHTTDVRPGDIFLLCSDGLLETVDDHRLLSLLAARCPLAGKQRQLVSLSAAHADNHSAWLIEVASVVADPDDRNQRNDEQSAACNALRYEVPVVLVQQEGVLHRLLRRFKSVVLQPLKNRQA